MDERSMNTAKAIQAAVKESLKYQYGDIVDKNSDLSFKLTGSNLPSSRAVNPALKYLSD